MRKDKVLEVQGLTVSFRTPNGLVRAVRDVSFDLYKGETLAIVGESGSGKSVTNRAIMGILAGNAIIDGGKINYENQDLTKLSEANFHKIRGNKIGMIFQDPLSSLNPTMKIGKQITEAMLVNGNRIKSRELDIYHYEFHNYLNVKEQIKILKSEIRNFSYEVRVNDELNKQEKKEKIAEIKSTHKNHIVELKKSLSDLKQKYLNKKKEAHEIVSAEVKEIETERDQHLADLKAELKTFPKAIKEVELPRVEKKKIIVELKKVHKVEMKDFKEKLKEIKVRFSSKKKEVKKVEDIREIASINKEAQKIKSEIIKIHKEIIAKKKTLKPAIIAVGTEEENRLKAEFIERKENLSNQKEAFRRKFKVTKREAYERAVDIMTEVGIPEAKKRFNQYSFQFSGGMRQRIVIATALTANPELLICDEPTTALDVTIQSQILNLIKELKKERELSVIFITHDLGVVANIADRVAVMYAGKIVEYGESEEIFYNPKHPYTWALLSSVPDLDTKERLISIPGTPPDMLFPPKGDAFAERNKYVLEIDFHEQPPFFKVSESHYAATWLLHPNAPKVEMPKIILERVQKYQNQDELKKVKNNDKK